MPPDPLDLTGFSRPKLALSACLGFLSCRYDGTGFLSPLPRRFFDWAEGRPFCPETQAGLGTPRTPIQWVLTGGRPTVVELKNGQDHLPQLEKTAQCLLGAWGELEGLLLKARSPSCALDDCPRYLPGTSTPTNFGPGVLGKAALDSDRPWILATEEQVKTPWGFELWAAGLFQLARLKALPDNLLPDFHHRQTALLEGMGAKAALEGCRSDRREYTHRFARAFTSPPEYQVFLANLGLGNTSPELPLRLDQLAALLGVSGQSLNHPYPPSLTATRSP
ncbi:MAG: hypothetical protein A2600_05935 [Candidatus Lambdaproteobacteria bacterium RIFOXYD1_FULL_56_27]|uniref:Uncharacterized protein n=1 Tax=Candidatus Lambdaproteobacteria bacterium RIFOXYD2_FULL_56_26 TaxID=1817773 RepID=A0A1F6GM58_9PROT|nr:MAG: hypothetical protein A2557_10060 [Candidatus Lambdaproteobacteria bacterium RIFOXYD2_FULL_56_26]OGH01750.1 MAG: hypothetical protein A2426_13970 [Candidatus Lambdaproteobacteria bacterium RIFOXYC1_FULL_56_13]OGH07623.1 MAG: hypothetical protein A2600_05935 [Candidatus Lambdaproteobacteria bacterium RIFOXYD1_FULL_56_27]